MSKTTKNKSNIYDYGFAQTVTTKKNAKKVTNIDAILRTIKKAGAKGLTCAQVEARLKFSHGTVSGRVADLENYGDIYNSGVRRTQSGREALVWVARGF